MRLMYGMKKWWFIISGIIIIPGIISLFVWGLKFGIDFRGGTIIEVQTKLTNEEIKNKLNDFSASVIATGQGTAMIKMGEINQKTHDEILTKLPESREVRFETVGPTVSKDLTKKAIYAVALASVAIILYIAFAFRKVPKPASSWRFGVCAVAALIHDLLVVIGIWSILGHFLGYEVDSLFITALLTIMGFSVHDTIVVFDRIRENLKRFPSLDFEDNVNNSVIQTLGRSLTTSLTVILVLLSLYLLGGDSTKQFVLALLIGITIGTYSSIFNASPLLIVWQNFVAKKSLLKR